jgi:hypothetical protein
MQIGESDWNVFLGHAAATLAKFQATDAERREVDDEDGLTVDRRLVSWVEKRLPMLGKIMRTEARGSPSWRHNKRIEGCG